MAKKMGDKISKEKASGKKVTWQWGNQKKEGKLIPSMETKDARYARTENGKIKKLPKKKS